MVSQRKSEQKGNGRDRQVPIQEFKRRHDDPNLAGISGLGNILNGLCMSELAPYLEPIVRRVVREEVERKIQEYLFQRARLDQGGNGISGARPLELRFLNKLPDTIFTLSNILAEDEERPVQIALFDVRSQSVVTDSPLSSIKVEILALNGEFCSDGREDWTEEEFNANILRQREAREPLLKGDRFIPLKDGVGCIDKIKFTDNSRWVRTGKFMLGAKALQSSSHGVSIKEGKSEPFVVKDSRGEGYKKHHPPLLDDDIWRLEKIAKDGPVHRRLSMHGINKVKDLLKLYIINPSSLHEKIGRIPKKSWEAMTEHAKACVIDDYNLYMYHTAEQPIGLLFNSIYMLVGVTFDGRNYCSPDNLNPYEKQMVELVKQHAYENVNNLKSVDNTPLNLQRLLTNLQSGQASAPNQGLQQLNFPIAEQGQPLASTPYVDEGMMRNEPIFANPLPDLAIMSENNLAEGEFFSGMYIEGNSWPHLTDNQNPQIQFTGWGQENGLHFGPYGGNEFSSNCNVDISGSGKPRAVWYKIRTALKWVISVRKDAAKKRMAKLLYYNC